MTTKRTKADYENAAWASQSIAGMCRYFGLKPCGGNYKIMHKAIKEYDLDIGHFTGQGWNTKEHPNFGNGISLEERFTLHKSKKASSKTKEILFNHALKEKRCEKCGITEWMGEPIIFQLHHINGDPKDDRLENLQILCPNCHSQTDSYCKRKEIGHVVVRLRI